MSPHEARELLYLMLHAEDPGLVPAGAHGLPVAHKIGWLEDTDNDVAIVFAPAGPTVITIYTVGAEDSTTARFGADATSAVLRQTRDCDVSIPTQLRRPLWSSVQKPRIPWNQPSR